MVMYVDSIGMLTHTHIQRQNRVGRSHRYIFIRVVRGSPLKVNLFSYHETANERRASEGSSVLLF
jgi:hypothetical protein